MPGSWHIKHNGITITLEKRADKPLHTVYSVTAQNKEINNFYKSTGLLITTPYDITLEGFFNDYGYKASYARADQNYITSCFIKNEQGEELLISKNIVDQPTTLCVTIKNKWLADLIEPLGYYFPREGTLQATANNASNYTKWSVQLGDNSTIKIPNFYNFITQAKGELSLDFFKRTIILKNVLCSLNKGTVSCKQAVLNFDPAFELSFFHAPFTINSCLAHWKKEFFSCVSGNLIATYSAQQKPFIEGDLIFEQSHLAENIFSQMTSTGQTIQETNPIACNITLRTKKPLHLKTPSLDADASLDLVVKNSLQNPLIAGHVTLLKGSMPFPYKELLITHGNLYLLPGQKISIDLTAKNYFKKWAITMHVTGEINNPNVHIFSSPPLTQEQIFSLLVTGHEADSLSTIMPAMVMNHVKQALVGEKIEHSYLTQLLQPIHIIPTLKGGSDQQLHGLVEIDISEKWHASIQKNLNAHEQPSVEVEYALFDDVNIKGLRNEHGDLQANLEMHWKFG